jgi:predicted permease
LITGIVALGTEVLVFLSLMEMPPFGQGGSDIIWALPFFGLVVLGLGISGLISAINVRRDTKRGGGLVVAGLLMNGLSLAVPILVLMFGVGRLLISAVA